MRTTISCSYAHPLSFINSCSPRLTVKLLYPKVGTQRALLIRKERAFSLFQRHFTPISNAPLPQFPTS